MGERLAPWGSTRRDLRGRIGKIGEKGDSVRVGQQRVVGDRKIYSCHGRGTRKEGTREVKTGRQAGRYSQINRWENREISNRQAFN